MSRGWLVVYRSRSRPSILDRNANSSPSTAQEVLRQIAYSNTSEDPSTAARTVRFVLTDGAGGTSNSETETIAVTALVCSALAATDIV